MSLLRHKLFSSRRPTTAHPNEDDASIVSNPMCLNETPSRHVRAKSFALGMGRKKRSTELTADAPAADSVSVSGVNVGGPAVTPSSKEPFRKKREKSTMILGE